MTISNNQFEEEASKEIYRISDTITYNIRPTKSIRYSMAMSASKI